MHHIHHSVARDKQGSNFGFNLACRDRWFGSYRESPRQPQATLELGLGIFCSARDQRLDRLLLQPFCGARPPR